MNFASRDQLCQMSLYRYLIDNNREFKLYKNGDMKHFQFHWSKGESVIVGNVLSTSLGLSWEPIVLYRAFRIKRSTKHSHSHQVNAINCLDWSEVSILSDGVFILYWYSWSYDDILICMWLFFHPNSKGSTISFWNWKIGNQVASGGEMYLIWSNILTIN